MAFQLAWRIRIVMLMVPVWPESGFLGRGRPGPGPIHYAALSSSSDMNTASTLCERTGGHVPHGTAASQEGCSTTGRPGAIKSGLHGNA